MLWRIRQFLAVAKISLLETIRQPVVLLVAASGIVFIALLPLFITFTMGEGERLVRDNGLAVHFFFGLLLGSTAAGTALTREIRRGAAAVILAKPVDRRLFFLAKYAGLAVVLLMYSACACLATILSSRMAAEPYVLDWWAGAPLLAAPVAAFGLAGLLNYLQRRPFASQAFSWLLPALLLALLACAAAGPRGDGGPFGAHLRWSVIPVSLLITLAVLVLSALALTLATRLEPVPILFACSAIFLVGLMSDYIFGRPAAGSAVAGFFYAIIPNWQNFWAADALAGKGVPWSYVAQAGAYAAAWLIALLSLGLFSFDRMEVGS